MGNSIFICMLILKLYMKYFYFMLLFVKKKKENPWSLHVHNKGKDGMSWEIRIKHFLNERQISMHRNLRSGCTDDR